MKGEGGELFRRKGHLQLQGLERIVISILPSQFWSPSWIHAIISHDQNIRSTFLTNMKDLEKFRTIGKFPPDWGIPRILKSKRFSKFLKLNFKISRLKVEILWVAFIILRRLIQRLSEIGLSVLLVLDWSVKIRYFDVTLC